MNIWWWFSISIDNDNKFFKNVSSHEIFCHSLGTFDQLFAGHCSIELTSIPLFISLCQEGWSTVRSSEDTIINSRLLKVVLRVSLKRSYIFSSICFASAPSTYSFRSLILFFSLLVWLASWLVFNGISIFWGHLIPNPSFYKNSCGTI